MANCTRFERAQCQHGAYCETFSVHDDPNECWKLKQQQPQKSMTNADRLRAMTDEQWLDWALRQKCCSLDYFPCGVVCEGKCDAFSEAECERIIMRWLKKPAERGAGNGK